jgi:hypothetical protein
MKDTLRFIENKDGSFTLEWDKEDPRWKFLNGLTSDEIQVIVEQTMREELNRHDQ